MDPITVTPTSGATYTFFDFIAFIDNAVGLGLVQSGSAAQFTLEYQDPDTGAAVNAIFEGFSFDYVIDEGEIAPVAGTIENVIVTVDSNYQGDITGIDLTIADLGVATDAEDDGSDPFAIETLFLTRDWIYEGTSAADNVEADDALPQDGYLFNPAGKDVIRLNGGDDVFFSGDKGDDLFGGGGNDNLNGGDGFDEIYGGAGDDFLKGENGADDIHGDGGDDELRGGRFTDTLSGGDGVDILKGSLAKDTLYGGAGGDDLFGGDDRDTLFGGAGGDSLNGNKGRDTITGGFGADHFVLGKNWGDDTITDFKLGTDLIDMSPSSASSFGDLTITNGSNGAVITYNGDTATLNGVSAGDLDAGDFVF